jgi:hypothetical protein
LANQSAFLTQIKGNFAEKVIKTLVFEKNAKFYAENCDHSIGPWGDFCQFSAKKLAFFLKNQCYDQNFA